MKKIVLISVVSLLIGSGVYLAVHENNQSRKAEAERYDSLKTDYTRLKAQYKGKSSYADSLLASNKSLYSQQQLTEAMSFRDASCKSLLNVGDRVMLRSDSSIAIISDRLIGGDRYTFYVKYVVQHKDKSTETLSPQMVIPVQ